ncbi:roadblock/LC7 domain-containing protein [Actinomadura chokoriensis]|uniref:roadblock/LC7 domain-containing protein n=1 Tax=Actinomadura chokoriensis TaxID=454156 RepID=UPI0031F75D28
MTTRMTPITAGSTPADEGLSWLLDEFVGRVIGVTAALLVSRDGLKTAAARLADDQADKAAAWVASLHSLARSAGAISGLKTSGFRQAVIEDDGVLVFVVSADYERHGGTGLVGSVLGVLARPDSDPGVIGHEIGLLVGSVADHLATRPRGDAHSSPSSGTRGCEAR